MKSPKIKNTTVSHESILVELATMPNVFSKVICKLSGDNGNEIAVNYYRTEKIITELSQEKPDYSFLDEIEGKTGVYIFTKNQTPVYIGKGGTKK